MVRECTVAPEVLSIILSHALVRWNSISCAWNVRLHAVNLQEAFQLHCSLYTVESTIQYCTQKIAMLVDLQGLSLNTPMHVTVLYKWNILPTCHFGYTIFSLLPSATPDVESH